MTAARAIALSSCLLLCLLCPVSGMAQPAAESPPDPNQHSPRAAIKTFFEAMRGFKAGNEGRLIEAIDCLYLGDDLSPEDRMNAGSGPAQTLFEAMDHVQFDMESIADETAGRNVQIRLGSGENAFEVHLRRYDDDKWRISSQSLTPEFLESLEGQVQRQRAGGGEAETQFVDGLESPRAAMEAFIKGMNGKDGFSQADAIDTLDLSGVNEVDRESVGASQASDLKALIDRIKLVEFSELPPESSGESYAFYQDPNGLGSITLAPVPAGEAGEQRAWRFTKSTLDSLEELYLAYKDRPLVSGLRQKAGSQPMANRIRDWASDNYPVLLETPFYLKNYQWLGLGFLILVGVSISRILTLFVGVFIRFWFRRKGYAYDDRLERDFIRPIRIALMAWVWLYGLTLLQLNPGVLEILRIAAFFITLVGAVWAAYCLVDIIGKYLTEMALKSASKQDDLLVPIIVRTLKIFVVVAGIVAFAFQLEGDATEVFAGLGLGGLALALAAKDVVANVFGSVTILTDQPFRIGDWVAIGEIEGTVESVGIRSTCIRTFYNSVITVPNSIMTTTHIDNLGARRYRRISATLGLTYDTPPERIEAFCEGIRELIRRHPYTRKDYFHVYFNGYAASSLEILVYCFVETPDWSTELREKHRLFLDILRLAKTLDVSFAFPTQTLFINKGANAQPQADSPAGPGSGVDAAREILSAYETPGGMPPPPVTFQGPEDTSSRTTKD